MKQIHVDLKENSYDIYLKRGILQEIGKHIDLQRKIMIITDDQVPQEYAHTLLKQCAYGHLAVVRHGEEAKSMEVYKELLENLLQHNFSRKDCVIALGGGVIGDLSGFVAASYMRGIDFINIPTTTLSQIDSSIGGKVAINLDEVKNIVGAFYQPKAVFIDPDTLATLPKRHYVNGIVEAIKAGLIYDASLFELFETGDIYDDIEMILEKALRVKKDVVEKDEKEQNLRKILNFGHTIGHAIESYYHLETYLHGECVAMGMLYFIKDETLKQRVLSLYKKLGLSTDVAYDSDKIYDLLSKDKKASNDYITIVEVEELGSAQLKEMPLTSVKELLV